MPSIGINVKEDDIDIPSVQNEVSVGASNVSVGVNVHEEDFALKPSVHSSRRSSSNRTSQHSDKLKPIVHSLESLIPTSARHAKNEPPRLKVDNQSSSRPKMRFRSKTDILDQNERLKTWQCLESMRIKKLGLPPERHSERYGAIRACTSKYQAEKYNSDKNLIRLSLNLDSPGKILENSPRNDYVPFITNKKPTCGFQFSDATDHRKPKLDVNYVDVVQWRSHQKKTSAN